MTPQEKIAKLAIWAANKLAPDASTEEAYNYACAVWRDNEQEFHWQERNDLKSFFFFLFGEFHYEHQKTAAEPDDAPTLREELQFDYPAYVDASGVMSVAEAQRLGIGEHERNCTCPECAGDEPDEPATVQEVHSCHLCGRDFPTYNAYIMHIEFCPGMVKEATQ